MWTRERKRPGHSEAGGWRSQPVALTISRHTLFSHTCLVFGLEEKYLHRFHSGVGIIYGLGVLLDVVCLLIVNVCMSFVVLIVRAPCFSRVSEIRDSLASNYAGVCAVRTSINILPSMFLLAILRQR